MKQCPVCNRTYFDDTLSYCLSDGNALTTLGTAGETATFVRPADEATVVRSGSPAMSGVQKQGSSGALKLLIAGLAGVVVILLVVVLGLAAFVWNRSKQTTDNGKTNANQAILMGANPTQSPDTDRSTPLPTPAPTAVAMSTPVPTPLPPEQRINDIPGQGRNFTDPGTSRLQFRRGNVGETFRGTVARQRSFVLRTMYGQWLEAAIRSSGNCVIFREASSETAFRTSNGDTSLTVVNRCSEPQDFTMTVTVR